MTKRLAVFSLLGRSVALVSDWAESAGFEVAILVTLPGPESDPHRHSSTVLSAPPRATVVVVPTVTACEAALRASQVDLGIVIAFSKLPDNVASIPCHGTVNVHPTLLPAYRGPNAYRPLYDGQRRIGATLHRVTDEIDAGPILAQSSLSTPEDLDPATALSAMRTVMTSVLEAGVPRALADEPGEDQEASAATWAPNFAPEEAVLDLNLSRRAFQCRACALMLADVQPYVMVDDKLQPVRAVRLLLGLVAGTPGVVTATSRRAVVALTDGVVELELGEMRL